MDTIKPFPHIFFHCPPPPRFNLFQRKQKHFEAYPSSSVTSQDSTEIWSRWQMSGGKRTLSLEWAEDTPGRKVQIIVWGTPGKWPPWVGDIDTEAAKWRRYKKKKKTILMNSWKTDFEWAVKGRKEHLATQLTFQAG